MDTVRYIISNVLGQIDWETIDNTLMYVNFSNGPWGTPRLVQIFNQNGLKTPTIISQRLI